MRLPKKQNVSDVDQDFLWMKAALLFDCIDLQLIELNPIMKERPFSRVHREY